MVFLIQPFQIGRRSYEYSKYFTPWFYDLFLGKDLYKYSQVLDGILGQDWMDVT